MNTINKKVTIKEFGFIDWFLYQYKEQTLIYLIISLIISCLVSFITTIIIVNSVINSNSCSNVSNNQRTNDINEYKSNTVD